MILDALTRATRGPKLHPVRMLTQRRPTVNVIQAPVVRFAPGRRDKGKGTKAAPGYFHGFARRTSWQADTRWPSTAARHLIAIGTHES